MSTKVMTFQSLNGKDEAHAPPPFYTDEVVEEMPPTKADQHFDQLMEAHAQLLRNQSQPAKSGIERFQAWAPMVTCAVLLVGFVRFDTTRENTTASTLADVKLAVTQLAENGKAEKNDRERIEREVISLNGELEGLKPIITALLTGGAKKGKK